MTLLITSDVQSGKLTTPNATVTTIVTFPLQADPSSGVARARIFAKKQGTDDAHQWSVVVGFHKDSTGALIVSGALVNLLSQASTLAAALWTVNADDDGSGNLIFTVKGAASTSVDWGCYAEVEYLFQQ
jgi:hypothetical protein